MGNWDSWIGKSAVIENYLDPIQARKMQATLDRSPSLDAGQELPPAWHWLYFHETAIASDLGRDGHTKLGVSFPEFPLPRRMWAGGSIQWHNSVKLGQNAKRETSILSIEEKQGRSGNLIFVTVEHQITQSEKLCIREEHNIVYRSEVRDSTAVEPELAESDSNFSQPWKFNETSLFRYSALTFNSHRIHYDQPYTSEVEGYPGLVVHGPLLATLMLDLAKTNNRPINQFSYRAKSTVTLPNGLFTHGRVSDSQNETLLWVANENGALAMTGKLS